MGFGRRLVVDREVAVFDADRDADIAGRQREGLAGDDAADEELLVLGFAGDRAGDRAEKLRDQVAAQERRRERIVGRRGLGEARVARQRGDDRLRVGVGAFRQRVVRIDRPGPVGQEARGAEVAREARGDVVVVDLHVGVRREDRHRLGDAARDRVNEGRRVVVAEAADQGVLAADEREELTPAFGVGVAAGEQRLDVPVDARADRQGEVGHAVERQTLGLVDRVARGVQRAVEHVLILGRVRGPRRVAGERAGGRAVLGRDEARAEQGVDDRVVVDRLAALERGAGEDRVVDPVDPGARRAVEHDVLRAAQVVAVANREVFEALIRGRDQDRAVVEVERIGAVDGERFAAAGERNVALNGDFRAVHVRTGDDVDHARDGVRAVDRRGAVLQDVDPLDRRTRNDVEVERADLAARAGRAGATIIQKDERALGAEAAQRDRVDAGAAFDDEAVELVVQLDRAGGDRGALDDLRGVDQTFEGRDFRGDDRDRGGRGERVAAQERAGDRDLAKATAFGAFLFLFFLSRLLLGFLRDRGHGRQRKGGGAAKQKRAQANASKRRFHQTPPGVIGDYKTVRTRRTRPRPEPGMLRFCHYIPAIARTGRAADSY